MAECPENEKLTEISAKTILDEIQNGEPYKPVVHNRVIVTGDLDANELKLSTECVERSADLLDEYKKEIYK